jgi:hypothetical protein
MSNNIKHEHAFHNQTKEIIHISKVTILNKKYLSCPKCKEILISVLNHQTQHFRHKTNLTCNYTNESYIHKLAKDVFKTMTKIDLPQINISNITFEKRRLFDDYIFNITRAKLPLAIQDSFKGELKKYLTNSHTYQIQNVEIEKTYKTKLGDVRIDIVLTINNKPIFIEPYFSNPINEEKLQKLELLNIPTISIPLQDFLDYYYTGYNENKLKLYLQKKQAKNWDYIQPSKLDLLIQKYYKYLDDLLHQKQSTYPILQQNENLIKIIESKINDSYSTIDYLNNQIKTIKDDPFKLYPTFKNYHKYTK